MMTIPRATTACRQFTTMRALLLCGVVVSSSAQIGLEICGCQPSVYEFTIDFDLTCEDQNVGGAGIAATTCLTELRGQEDQTGADVRPALINQVSIFELNQNSEIIAQTFTPGNFLNGDTFRYTSIIATSPETLDEDSLPRGIQLVFTGVNTQNRPVVNYFGILYTNDCGVFPLLREGQMAGWAIFSDLGNPPELLCPIASEPSSSPTEMPSMTPGATAAPTRRPTFSPTNSPVVGLPPPPPPVCPPLPEYERVPGKGGGKGGEKGGKAGKSKSGKSKSNGGKDGKSKSEGKAKKKKKAKDSDRDGKAGKKLRKSSDHDRYLKVGNRPECPEPIKMPSSKSAESRPYSGKAEKTGVKGERPSKHEGEKAENDGVKGEGGKAGKARVKGERPSKQEGGKAGKAGTKDLKPPNKENGKAGVKGYKKETGDNYDTTHGKKDIDSTATPPELTGKAHSKSSTTPEESTSKSYRRSFNIYDKVASGAMDKDASTTVYKGSR